MDIVASLLLVVELVSLELNALFAVLVSNNDLVSIHSSLHRRSLTSIDTVLASAAVHGNDDGNSSVDRH